METETQTLDEIKITNIRSIVFPNAPRPDDFINFSIDGLFSLEYNKSGSKFQLISPFIDGWTTAVDPFVVPVEFISDVYKVPLKIETNNDDTNNDTYFKIDKVINYKEKILADDPAPVGGGSDILADDPAPTRGGSDEYFVIEILGYVNTKNITKDQIKKYLYSTFINIDDTIKLI